MSSELPAAVHPAKVVFYNDPKVRSIVYQLALCAAVAFLVYGAASNAIENLARAHIASGFGFWENTAGFDISQTLIEYSSRGSTYGRAFWVGLLNTLLVAGVGIVFRDHHRLCRRHLAAVAQLAGGESCRRLCRNHPQSAAAAAIAVLVQRGAQGAAGYSRQRGLSAAASISTIAACFCRSRFSRPASAPC